MYNFECSQEDNENRNNSVEVPEFIITYFLAQIKEYIETLLLPDFHNKFKVPKEEEWLTYLEEYMPIYKKSHKKAAERVLPFDATVYPYPKLLQFAYVILKSLNIQDFAKLDLEYAPT